ncbi:alpha/beta hydrolase [Ornithinibacter aureus]|uniref:alpha/beta hydrolase n=2 Tax=Ornithinibacter aureus TaxID=622664 RepID=UPI001358000E|nr:alpha/beta hydrolase [Ornithinibacter aureus]KAF0834721.1 TAP-like protein [Ornithinibacter aureus]
MRRRQFTSVAGLAVIGALVAGTLSSAPAIARTSTTTTVVSTAATAASTAAAEARLVDRVPTPRPTWFNCDPLSEGAKCAMVPLPLDYDKPTGAKTEVAVLRLPARDPSRRIGSLFLNPGGPGGSGVEIAAMAPYFLSDALLDRFDIIGFDPRGTNFSDSVRCWPNLGAQVDAIEPLFTVPFPFERAEVQAYTRASEAFGRACSTTGTPLSASMSTAEVARDMDVLRRMTGDTKLTYLGFSYGSYLGTVYANLFPARVRSVAIDGVIDPVAWAGTAATASVPQTQRIRSGEGAAKALAEILKRCTKAGPEYCQFASFGDPATVYAEIRASLQAEPLQIIDPETGESFGELTYAVLTAFLLSDMYSPEAGWIVDMDLTWVYTLMHGEAEPGTPEAARQVAAARALGAKVTAQRSAGADAARDLRDRGRAVGWAFPYDNSPEAFQSVLCTDGRNPSRASNWSGYAASTDRTAPDFGRMWTWASAPCASSTWTARDEDAFRGPFTAKTANPVLVVGNYWDPATNYDGAVATSKLLPNSRLLRSDNWGHTAYGTSACATTTIDRYLLTSRIPPRNKTCHGDVQPFTEPLGTEDMRRATPSRQLPPVVPPIPGAVPRT